MFWMRFYDSGLCRMLAWWATHSPNLAIVWELSGSHWAGSPCIWVSLHGIESHVLFFQSTAVVLCAVLSFLSPHNKIAGCVANMLELPTHHLQGVCPQKPASFLCKLAVSSLYCSAESVNFRHRIAGCSNLWSSRVWRYVQGLRDCAIASTGFLWALCQAILGDRVSCNMAGCYSV